MNILLPAALSIVGLLGGAGAGWYMRPAPPIPPEPCFDETGAELAAEVCAARRETEALTKTPTEAGDSGAFVKLDRQFIVPVVSEDRVASMMVLTINLEVEPRGVEPVLALEPKLRDALLRAMFDHAYTGGFSGDFTAEPVMRELRGNLLLAARRVAGADVRNVLVADIIRQDQ
ncbi:MAG: flagellar basal body-associated protein FliL [Rhodobacteraceae bacterium]|nr:MAG: flagellar basal body-associated protein FliL [Paracoccaceae bacterium]